MKYNFKGSFRIVFISLLVLLCGVLIKFVFEEEDVSYHNKEVYTTINNDKTSKTTNQDLEISNKDTNITYDKVAYITIDDGPSKFTKQILDILDRNNVKATFFMINKNMNIYKVKLRGYNKMDMEQDFIV